MLKRLRGIVSRPFGASNSVEDGSTSRETLEDRERRHQPNAEPRIHLVVTYLGLSVERTAHVEMPLSTFDLANIFAFTRKNIGVPGKTSGWTPAMDSATDDALCGLSIVFSDDMGSVFCRAEDFESRLATHVELIRCLHADTFAAESASHGSGIRGLLANLPAALSFGTVDPTQQALTKLEHVSLRFFSRRQLVSPEVLEIIGEPRGPFPTSYVGKRLRFPVKIDSSRDVPMVESDMHWPRYTPEVVALDSAAADSEASEGETDDVTDVDDGFVMVDAPRIRQRRSDDFLDVGTLKRFLELEFYLHGVGAQFARDVVFWKETLRLPSLVHASSKRAILRRLFSMIRFGGLLYRPNGGSAWREFPHPIASALSHGGRVLFQIPPLSENGCRDSFWNWLLTGDSRVNPIELENSSLVDTSRMPMQSQHCVFYRWAATHTVTGLGRSSVGVPTTAPNIRREIAEMRHIRSLQEEVLTGFANRRRIAEEDRSRLGLNYRDTKIALSSLSTYSHHKHWAMNVACGGASNHLYTGAPCSDNGNCGSLYLYHKAPKKDRFGVLLAGMEASEYGHANVFGELHSVKAKSSLFSPTFGFKWQSKTPFSIAAGAKELSPDKHNGMLVDLSSVGWEMVAERIEVGDWLDEMVGETALPILKTEDVVG